MNPSLPPPDALPPPKKSNWLLWALLGCGGFMLLVAAVVTIGGYFVFQKVKEVVDPELMRKNPTAAVGKILEMTNPDVEVIKVDSSSGSVTLKDKKTGKIVTMNLDDIKKGKITFEGPDGERAEIGTAKLPDWIPAYPGSSVTTGISGTGADGAGGMVGMTADGKAEDIIKWYEDKLTAAGMAVESKTLVSGSQSGVLAMKDGKKGAVVTVNGEPGGKSQVSIVYGGPQ